MARSTILGVGSFVPDKVVTNDDLAQMMNTSDEWIQQRTGIKERHFIAESGTGASDLAVPATERALEHAGVKKEEIDAIIFATLSPDYTFPGSGCLLGHKLGLPGVPALDIRNQCSGFLYGLSIADAWVRAGMYEKVLLVGSEVHSTGLDFTDRGRDIAVLFGDGAGAAVIGKSKDDVLRDAERCRACRRPAALHVVVEVSLVGHVGRTQRAHGLRDGVLGGRHVRVSGAARPAPRGGPRRDLALGVGRHADRSWSRLA